MTERQAKAIFAPNVPMDNKSISYASSTTLAVASVSIAPTLAADAGAGSRLTIGRARIVPNIAAEPKSDSERGKR